MGIRGVREENKKRELSLGKRKIGSKGKREKKNTR